MPDININFTIEEILADKATFPTAFTGLCRADQLHATNRLYGRVLAVLNEGTGTDNEIARWGVLANVLQKSR